MRAPCHNTTQAMKLLQFCGNWDSSSLCFLCYMQKWCKIHYTLNTLSSNYSLLQFEFNLHVVFTTIRYARRCYTYCRDLCWFHLLVEFTQSSNRKFCYIPGIFPSWFTYPPPSSLYTRRACFSDRVSERLGDKLDWKHLFLLLC